ncbi:hypothetical protein PV11_05521 [Exophiala sideris]|uniref:Uncharacterized protein n=1 Tax=Exophiala sideris TaxID=1016849 RepID=A0A0D1W477_9EURO|nr:hypothetical protein PV11_05521 [Exophiala sideris]
MSLQDNLLWMPKSRMSSVVGATETRESTLEEFDDGMNPHHQQSFPREPPSKDPVMHVQLKEVTIEYQGITRSSRVGIPPGRNKFSHQKKRTL